MWKGTLWPFERFVVDFIYKVLLSAARNRATIGRRTKRARSFWITRKMTVESMAAIYDDFVIVEHPVTVEEALKQVHSSGARLLVVRSRGEIVGVCDAHGLLLQLGKGTAELACSESFAVVDEEALFQQRPDQASFWLIQNDRGGDHWLAGRGDDGKRPDETKAVSGCDGIDERPGSDRGFHLR